MSSNSLIALLPASTATATLSASSWRFVLISLPIEANSSWEHMSQSPELTTTLRWSLETLETWVKKVSADPVIWRGEIRRDTKNLLDRTVLEINQVRDPRIRNWTYQRLAEVRGLVCDFEVQEEKRAAEQEANHVATSVRTMFGAGGCGGDQGQLVPFHPPPMYMPHFTPWWNAPAATLHPLHFANPYFVAPQPFEVKTENSSHSETSIVLGSTEQSKPSEEATFEVSSSQSNVATSPHSSSTPNIGLSNEPNVVVDSSESMHNSMVVLRSQPEALLEHRRDVPQRGSFGAYPGMLEAGDGDGPKDGIVYPFRTNGRRLLRDFTLNSLARYLHISSNSLEMLPPFSRSYSPPPVPPPMISTMNPRPPVEDSDKSRDSLNSNNNNSNTVRSHPYNHHHPFVPILPPSPPSPSERAHPNHSAVHLPNDVSAPRSSLSSRPPCTPKSPTGTTRTDLSPSRSLSPRPHFTQKNPVHMRTDPSPPSRALSPMASPKRNHFAINQSPITTSTTSSKSNPTPQGKTSQIGPVRSVPQLSPVPSSKPSSSAALCSNLADRGQFNPDSSSPRPKRTRFLAPQENDGENEKEEDEEEEEPDFTQNLGQIKPLNRAKPSGSSTELRIRIPMNGNASATNAATTTTTTTTMARNASFTGPSGRGDLVWRPVKRGAFKCLECEAPFDNYVELGKHMTRAHVVREQQCNSRCTRSKQQAQNAQHELKCQLCHKVYQRFENYRKHMISVHNSILPS